LTQEPVEERRRKLEEIVTVTGPMKVTVYTDGDGKRFFEAAKNLGFEGVVAKKLGSKYVPGRRTKDWRKIKAVNRQDCVVLGWTRGGGSRAETFGSLLVGAYREGELIWIGQVGTGFTESVLDDLMKQLGELETQKPPIADRSLLAVKGARWVRPELVCEVEYLQMTKAGKLRAPSYKGLRPDKVPADCILEPPAA
jgi:bifunctional non-homologous end joining protein LigD